MHRRQRPTKVPMELGKPGGRRDLAPGSHGNPSELNNPVSCDCRPIVSNFYANTLHAISNPAASKTT